MSEARKPRFTARQKEAVRSLHGDPNFKEYLDLLDNKISVRTEELVDGGDDLQYLRGRVLGLKEARNLVDTLLEHLERQHNARESRKRHAEHRQADKRKLAVFGSGWFSKL